MHLCCRGAVCSGVSGLFLLGAAACLAAISLPQALAVLQSDARLIPLCPANVTAELPIIANTSLPFDIGVALAVYPPVVSAQLAGLCASVIALVFAGLLSSANGCTSMPLARASLWACSVAGCTSLLSAVLMTVIAVYATIMLVYGTYIEADSIFNLIFGHHHRQQHQPASSLTPPAGSNATGVCPAEMQASFASACACLDGIVAESSVALSTAALALLALFVGVLAAAGGGCSALARYREARARSVALTTTLLQALPTEDEGRGARAL